MSFRDRLLQGEKERVCARKLFRVPRIRLLDDEINIL